MGEPIKIGGVKLSRADTWVALFLAACLLVFFAIRLQTTYQPEEEAAYITTSTLPFNTSVFMEKVAPNRTQERVDEAVTAAAVYYAHPALCRKASEEERDLCLYKVAAANLTASVCNLIADKKFATQCRENVEDISDAPSITLHRPFAKVAPGQKWSVVFTTKGVDDLMISPAFDATFAEFPSDDSTTLDDLAVEGLTCDGDAVFGADLRDVALVSSHGVAYPERVEGSRDITGLVVPDYSCSGESTLTVRVISQGRHGLRLDFGYTTKRAMVQS